MRAYGELPGNLTWPLLPVQMESDRDAPGRALLAAILDQARSDLALEKRESRDFLSVWRFFFGPDRSSSLREITEILGWDLDAVLDEAEAIVRGRRARGFAPIQIARMRGRGIRL